MKRLVMLVLGITLLSSCKTTGDPNKGGLIGWSRDKADVRAVQFEKDAQTAAKDADDEQQKSQQLTKTLSSEKASRNRYKDQVKALMNENLRLHEKLTNLKDSEHQMDSELAVLEAERSKLMQQLSVQGDIVIDNQHQPLMEPLSQLNERYKEAILMLLQQ